MDASFLILEKFKDLNELQRIEIHLRREQNKNLFKSFSLAKYFSVN